MSFKRRGRNYNGKDSDDCGAGRFLLHVVEAGLNGLRGGLNKRPITEKGTLRATGLGRRRRKEGRAHRLAA